MPEFYEFNEAGNMKESAPTRCPNGHPLGLNTVLVGALPCLCHPPATVHRTWRHSMRCMHDAACVFPQPRVDNLAIHLSRQVDPGSCARSDGGTRVLTVTVPDDDIATLAAADVGALIGRGDGIGSPVRGLVAVVCPAMEISDVAWQAQVVHCRDHRVAPAR